MMERSVQAKVEEEASIRESCGPVELAAVSAHMGVEVPTPRLPEESMRALSTPPVVKFKMLAAEEKIPVSESVEKEWDGAAAVPRLFERKAPAKIPFAKVEVPARPVTFKYVVEMPAAKVEVALVEVATM